VSAIHSGAILIGKQQTEVNNYGFEIERRGISSELLRQEAVMSNWEKVGFVCRFRHEQAHRKNIPSPDCQSRVRKIRFIVSNQIDRNGAFNIFFNQVKSKLTVPKRVNLITKLFLTHLIHLRQRITVPEDGRASLKIYNTIASWSQLRLT